MPFYRLWYSVEAPLQYDSDFSLDVSGHKAHFLFSKQTQKGTVSVRIDVEGDDARQAEEKASGNFLPRVLDALSFSVGTPLLLHECYLILKREPGSENRRGLFANVSQVSSFVYLWPGHLEDAQRVLANEREHGLPLCWHRYAVQRGYAFDRFLFQWLTFEGLAGTSQIEIKCPECGDVRVHSGSNKRKAYELFRAADRTSSRTQFNDDVWGSARNRVFHGVTYPEPKFLAELNKLSRTLRTACEISFAERYGVSKKSKIAHAGLKTWQHFSFIEWKTSDPRAEFAADFPEASVSQYGGPGKIGEIGINMPAVSNFSILDINKEYVGW